MSGHIILYSFDSNVELYQFVENTLSEGGFHLNHPVTNLLYVWTEEGDLIHIDREEAIHRLNAEGALLSFWDKDCNDLGVVLYRDSDMLNTVSVTIDGLDSDVCFSILSMLTSSLFKKSSINGLLFDRRDNVEDYDWKDVFENGVTVKEFTGKFDCINIISERILQQSDELDVNKFDVENVYVGVKLGDGSIKLSELRVSS